MRRQAADRRRAALIPTICSIKGAHLEQVELSRRSSTDRTTAMKTVFVLLIAAVLVASAESYETITGHTGENVNMTFPDCSSNPSSSVRVQKRGSNTYIYSCIDGHPIKPDHQDPSFVGRVEGMKCPMTVGVISVNVTGLTTNDSGEIDLLVINSDGTKCRSDVYLKVTDRGAADGGDVRGNSGLVRVIAGGTLAAAGIIIIIVVYLCCSRFKSWMMRCRDGDQKNSELPVTYKEVDQQQV